MRLEAEFRQPLDNDWHIAGKRDGVIRRGGKLWVLEHKTTRKIDATYIEKLWMDWQIVFYVMATEREYGEPVAGVVYNIIEKYRDHARELGESDVEWEQRLKEAKAPGRCKRRMPESPEDHAARLAAYYAAPERYRREEIIFTEQDVADCLSETLEIALQWADARRRSVWYKNTGACYRWNRACAYLPICKSRGSQVVIDNLYRKADKPNRELSF
jgi:hypothetical protein